MSTDFDIVCDNCKVYHHLGQWMGGDYTFGYGSKDEEGRRNAMKFIGSHLYCDLDRSDYGKHGLNKDGTRIQTCRVPFLRVVVSDDTPADYKDVTPPAS